MDLNWLAILAAVICGQIISTLWFTVMFGKIWAQEFGVKTSKEHTSQIPGYTYGIGLLCTIAMTVTIAILHRFLSVYTMKEAFSLGIVLAFGLCAATILPGQAFLKRYTVAFLSAGSQVVMILAISLILAAF